MEVVYENAFKEIITFLEKIELEKGIKYYLVGGILSSLYTEIRTTKDIDFVVDLFSVNCSINSYVSLLQEHNFRAFQDWQTAISLAKQNKIIQFLDSQDKIKFDNYLVDAIDPNKYKK